MRRVSIILAFLLFTAADRRSSESTDEYRSILLIKNSARVITHLLSHQRHPTITQGPGMTASCLKRESQAIEQIYTNINIAKRLLYSYDLNARLVQDHLTFSIFEINPQIEIARENNNYEFGFLEQQRVEKLLELEDIEFTRSAAREALLTVAITLSRFRDEFELPPSLMLPISALNPADVPNLFDPPPIKWDPEGEARSVMAKLRTIVADVERKLEADTHLLRDVIACKNNFSD